MEKKTRETEVSSRRGGARPGGGRPKGSKNKATLELKKTIQAIAQEYTHEAIYALVEVCRKGRDAAKVAAATAILDRAYGRPAQAHELSGPGGQALVTRIIIEAANGDGADQAAP